MTKSKAKPTAKKADDDASKGLRRSSRNLKTVKVLAAPQIETHKGIKTTKPGPPAIPRSKQRKTTTDTSFVAASSVPRPTSRKAGGTASRASERLQAPSSSSRNKRKQAQPIKRKTAAPSGAKKRRGTDQSRQQQQEPRCSSSSDSPATSEGSEPWSEGPSSEDEIENDTASSVPSTIVINARYQRPNLIDQEIRRLQMTTEALIPRAPFCKLIQEVTMGVYGNTDIRYKGAALAAIQEAAEHYLIGLLQDANLLCNHANRVTLFPSDIRLAYRLRGD